MPKDGWGEVKTVSLKAWLKRNDSRHLIDDSYIYGDIKLLNELCSSRLIMYINKKVSMMYMKIMWTKCSTAS